MKIAFALAVALALTGCALFERRNTPPGEPVVIQLPPGQVNSTRPSVPKMNP